MISVDYPDSTTTGTSIWISTTADSTIGPTDATNLSDWNDGTSSGKEYITVTSTSNDFEEPEEEIAPQPRPRWRDRREIKPKSREFVKIHNPPGGWGLGRF